MKIKKVFETTTLGTFFGPSKWHILFFGLKYHHEKGRPIMLKNLAPRIEKLPGNLSFGSFCRLTRSSIQKVPMHQIVRNPTRKMKTKVIFALKRCGSGCWILGRLVVLGLICLFEQNPVRFRYFASTHLKKYGFINQQMSSDQNTLVTFHYTS